MLTAYLSLCLLLPQIPSPLVGPSTSPMSTELTIHRECPEGLARSPGLPPACCPLLSTHADERVTANIKSTLAQDQSSGRSHPVWNAEDSLWETHFSGCTVWTDVKGYSWKASLFWGAAGQGSVGPTHLIPSLASLSSILLPFPQSGILLLDDLCRNRVFLFWL